MSDIEQRLRTALAARAELVQPEDLNLNPVLEPPEEPPGPWWRHPGAYLFVAAVVVIMIGLPLLALAAAGPDGEPDPSDLGSDPTMVDPVPGQVDRALADVDGDGAPDEVRVVTAAAASANPGSPGAEMFSVEVDLSSGGTVTHLLGASSEVLIGATANLDGRRGEEVVVVLDPTSIDRHRGTPVVISLRDDELASIIDDDTGGPAGTPVYWWVHEAQLWWWESEGGAQPEGQTPLPVDVVRFPRDPVLKASDEGAWCVTSTAPTELVECGDPE